MLTWVICLLSWFPRISVILSGYRTYNNMTHMTIYRHSPQNPRIIVGIILLLVPTGEEMSLHCRSLYRQSLLGTGSWSPARLLPPWTALWGHRTDHGYHHISIWAGLRVLMTIFFSMQEYWGRGAYCHWRVYTLYITLFDKYLSVYRYNK